MWEWPVLLVIYNLPPWLCMKRKYMMLSMMISGPRQPGNDIDVYLSPLIEASIDEPSDSSAAVIDDSDQGGVRKSQRARQPSSRLQDYELIHDSAIGEEGELVHLALFAESESVSLEEAMNDTKWTDAM